MNSFRFPSSFLALGWGIFVFLGSGTSEAQDRLALAIGPHRDLTVKSISEGVSEIVVTGNVPHLWTNVLPPEYDPARHTMLSFEYFAPGGMEAVSLRYRQSDGSMTFATTSSVPLAETWQPLALDFSAVSPPPPKGDPESRFHLSFEARPGTTMRIRALEVRVPDPQDLAAAARKSHERTARAKDAEAIIQHVRADYPGELREVIVERDLIRLSGRAGESSLVQELRIYQASHLPLATLPGLPEVQGEFSVEVPRFDPADGHDRALSRWRLESPEGRIVSRARWFDATDEGVAADLPELRAPHQKGLAGIPALASGSHEIFELGIAHATINIVVSSLVSAAPLPGFTPFSVDGRQWFANSGALERLGETVRILNEKSVIVSGILLVPNQVKQPMTHPEAEPRGIYSMPNLAEAEGAAHYRAAIHLVTERFARPETRIANWIIHNEIDQAGVWTNMGDQPLSRYLDSYVRSARLVYHSARLRDPHARVFISLTHHWAKQSSGSGTYQVRELLDQFAEMSVAEGDFEWGLAYHPYPQDLRNPDAWKDTEVTGDFDTPYITPKNLEVLPAYLAQSPFLYLGNTPRAILFSEQGFNTPTLSEVDQKRQVTGLIYTFRKLRDLPTVEAWHHHRYQDMPEGEGGLRLGLIDEHGRHKLAWDAYAAIRTGEESAFDPVADALLAPAMNP